MLCRQAEAGVAWSGRVGDAPVTPAFVWIGDAGCGRPSGSAELAVTKSIPWTSQRVIRIVGRCSVRTALPIISDRLDRSPGGRGCTDRHFGELCVMLCRC